MIFQTSKASVTPRFQIPPNSFHAELKRRINEYFEDTKQATTGNWRLYGKAAVLLALQLTFYTVLVFFTPVWYISLPMCVLMGFISAAVGFNVMHDGGHGSFSKNPKVNRIAALTLDFLGGSSYMWNVKHNVGHHTFTNIEGADDDIDSQPFFRLNEQQEWHKFHRYQHLYWVVFYGLMYMLWVFVLDYIKYFKGQVGLIKVPKMRWQDQLIFWGSKATYLFLYLVLPMIFVGVLETIIGYVVFGVVTGLLISIVFQLAHIVEHTEFPIPNDAGKIEEEWAVHQIQTTANFATRNRLITWFAGGLNFQIEHHLFPKISHIHYPAISKIIKKTCEEYDIHYIEYKRMTTAIRSHIRILKNMGQPA